MTELPKILLLGNGPTSLSALESLTERFAVVGIVRESAEDGRDKDVVIRHARTIGVPIYPDAGPAAVAALLRQLHPDCVVVSSYNRILRPEVLQECRFINVHYAPLPRYRGRACVNWAIINGESCTAITIHALVPELDAGNVLFQRFVPIGESDTVTDIYRSLNELQKANLAVTVSRYLAGEIGEPQVEADATYGCTRLPQDGEINWASTTDETFRLIRSLTDPFPGAYTYFSGRRMVVWQAEPVADPPRYSGRIPGRVISVSQASGRVDVLTGDGILSLVGVELEGDIKRPPAQIIKSVRVTLGLCTKDLVQRISQLDMEIKELRRQSNMNSSENSSS